MHTLYNYLQIYLSRPTVVIVDMSILFITIIIFIGIIGLKRKIDDLNVVIELLKRKLSNIN